DARRAHEEVRRRGRRSAVAPAFSRAKTLLRDALIEQGIWRGAGPGLDRAREYSIDHGIRQGYECAAGRYGALAQQFVLQLPQTVGKRPECRIVSRIYPRYLTNVINFGFQ